MNKLQFPRPQLLLAVIAFLVAPSVARAQYSRLNEPAVHHHEDFVNAIDQSNFNSSYSFYDSGCSCCGTLGSRPKHFTRTLPPGTLAQHYPYDALKFYYYDRPHNSYHVDRRYNNGAGQFTGTPRQPYSKKIYQSIYSQIEQQIADDRILEYPELSSNLPMESAKQQIARDKNFEYSDWQKHYRARLNWENKRMFAEQANEQLESPIELKDVGHTYNHLRGH